MIFRKKNRKSMMIFFFQQTISVDVQLLIIFLAMRTLISDQAFS